MEKVNCYKFDRWGWECPRCGDWNEQEEDPDTMESVFCYGCEEEFKPVVE